MTDTRHTREFRFYWGNDSFRTELLSSLRGRWSLTGGPILEPDEANDGTDDVITSYVLIGVSFAASLSCKLTPEVKEVLNNPKGIFACVGPGTEFGWAFPANVLGRPLRSPARGLIGVQLGFAQDPDSEAVQAVPITSGSNRWTAERVGYLIADDAITEITAAASVSAGNIAIVGTPTL